MNTDERVMKEQLIMKAAAGDDSALDEAVKENMGLVRSIVRRFIGRGCDPEDLLQIGSIGLIKAIRNFNTDYNVCFSTYAVPMITGEIKRFLRDDGPVKVSRSIKELYIKIRNTSDVLKAALKRDPTPKEIADEIGVEVSEVILALEAVQPVESIYSQSQDGSGISVCLLDRIANNECVSSGQFDIMKDGTGDFEKIIDNIALKETMEKLSDNEQKIIKLRYFKGFTQTDAAKVLGISQVQVSRLEKKILSKMKFLIQA